MKKVAILLLGTAMLSGCGSDESGDSRASSSFVGAIESVDQNNDSIKVGSKSLNVSHAEIKLNDMPINFIELNKGMQVDVEYDNGVAYEVELEPVVVGKVSHVTSADITINGQTFKHADLAAKQNILADQRAMLFGYLNDSKEWVITAIYNADFLPNDVHEGVVSDFDRANNTFKLNSTFVESKDYDDVNELSNGVWVEIEGSYNTTSKIFDATDVDVENELDLANAEVEGYVTTLNNEKTSMTLNGKTVIAITENTRFEDGTKDQLKVGSKVDVDLINNAGQLQASEIEFD
ncbi:DUF5666 domain-containing protein [uncultured Aliivibrio sp.]|uniref:DUF5666 domain-containing protein n=1 Tax=uncultured Aliivibrio sp. TaxID=873085 RepID=UPI00260AF343|nr:DUF5666 domain-containing protein [uncultured Aliivibrio sp.]